MYGDGDFDAIIAQADDGRLAGNKGAARLSSVYRTEGGDHYYSGMQDVLLKRMQVVE